MPRSLRFLLSLSLLVGLPGLTGASDDAQRSFADRVAREHGLERDRVQGMLDDAQHRDAIIEAISSPAEALPWHRYREIFVTDERAQEGAQFQARHAETLDRVAAEYGVDPDIITAILGIETRYGEHRGEHRVLDALVTLGFDYPPRASFFRDELEEFLVLAEAEGLDPRSVRGSYAGAMGIPQFIASSYRHYAVDGDGDGRRDLLESVPDAIASVANYLSEHGWRQNDPIATPARLGEGAEPEPLLADGMRLNTTVGALREAGIEPRADYSDDATALLLELDGDDGTEYWVGRHNFRVITRYNHSPLYALAAVQLADAIEAAAETNP